MNEKKGLTLPEFLSRWFKFFSDRVFKVEVTNQPTFQFQWPKDVKLPEIKIPKYNLPFSKFLEYTIYRCKDFARVLLKNQKFQTRKT